MKFEYLVVFFEKFRLPTDKAAVWHPVNVGGKALPAEERKKTLYAFVNELGLEGWENVWGWRAGNYQQWTFKRLPLKG